MTAKTEEARLKHNAYMRGFYANNKEAWSVRAKIWRDTNSESNLAKKKVYREQNAEKVAAGKRDWYLRNREHVLKKVKKHRQQKVVTDIQYKLRIALRRRMYMAIKSNQKSGSAVSDLGCAIPEFVAHIAANFEIGMTWQNWGEWHIDHKKPLASLDLTDREQFLIAANFKNMQPLWASENRKKHAKTEGI